VLAQAQQPKGVPAINLLKNFATRRGPEFLQRQNRSMIRFGLQGL
jgi:hypothetical protein